jgi:hypothetical protein
MKTLKSLVLLLAVPCSVQAQFLQNSGNFPKFYVGTDAYIRNENIKLVDPGNRLASNNWMWNFSYGFNAGYRPGKWLTLEVGLYRFTFAERVNFKSNFFSRSFSEPYSALVIPVRAYIDPFAFSQPKPKRWRLQLMAGMSVGSLKRYEGPPTKFSGSVNASSLPDDGKLPDDPFHLAASQIVDGQILNLEGGINAQYRLGRSITLSGNYGYTLGLSTVHAQNIRYRSEALGPVYQSRQTSNGSGRTIMIGVKYFISRE